MIQDVEIETILLFLLLINQEKISKILRLHPVINYAGLYV